MRRKADNFSESIKCPLNADEKPELSKGVLVFLELKGNNSCEGHILSTGNFLAPCLKFALKISCITLVYPFKL